MYAVVNAKKLKDVVKQFKSVGGVAVMVKKFGQVLYLMSYHMPNNCYNGGGVPQYYPCGSLLSISVKLELTGPLQNGDFEFYTTLEDLKAGLSCASGGCVKISFEDGVASCSGSYQQTLHLVDASESGIVFKDIDHDDSIVFSVPVESLKFARPFANEDDWSREEFMNICVEEGGIVATDGHALGVKDWHMGENAELQYQVPIPAKVADVIVNSGTDAAIISAFTKTIEVLNPLKNEKEKRTDVVGVFITAGDYLFTIAVEKEFKFPNFKKVFPERYDNQFIIDADAWCSTISNLAKGFNYPHLTVTDEPGNFVFDIHEIRTKKGKVALGDRQAKLPRDKFVDYAWSAFKCDARLLCKALKAQDSTHTMIHVQDELVVLESWAGKSIVMQMQ